MKAAAAATQVGIVKSYDGPKAYGLITPEAGGAALRFESSAIKWGRSTNPAAAQRLSFELGTDRHGKPCAVNLREVARP